MKNRIKKYGLLAAVVILCGGCVFAINKNKDKKEIDNDSLKQNNNLTSVNGKIADKINPGNNPFCLENLIPTDKDSLIYYDHTYYVIGYNNKHKQAGWVAWLLTRDMVENKRVKRLNNFRVDERLQCCCSTPADYNRSGYDKGHLCPSGDMTWSKQANSETFLMSNMSPQNQKLNRGRWNDLENWTREQALDNDSLLVITGPIFDTVLKTIGSNSVSVPVAYFKIIVDISSPTYKTIAFIMRNDNLKEKIFSYSTSIKEIEHRTKLNFFPKFDSDSLIQALEHSTNKNNW